jgi:hypothetical protein
MTLVLYRRVIALALLAATSVASTGAQLETIPERLAKAGRSLGNSTTVPSGLPPTIQEIVRQSDLIVLGTISNPRSYLSDDQTEVFTDYSVLRPVTLFTSTVARVPGPVADANLTVTFLGGKVTINGLVFSAEHEALPLPEPGTECVLLLKRVGGRHFVSGRYFGMFQTSGDRVTPLVRKPGFASEYAGATGRQFADEMTRIARESRKR